MAGTNNNTYNRFRFGAPTTPNGVTNGRQSFFTTTHFRSPITSSSLQFRYGKRKSNNESLFHPVSKQQITEARIASSMQMLSLESNDRPSHSNSGGSTNFQSLTKRTSDEGFFEDSDVSSDDDDLNDVDISDSGNTHDHNTPRIRIHEDVKKNLKRMWDDILPETIMKSINQNSLALVPYRPPEDILLSRIAVDTPKRETTEKATKFFQSSAPKVPVEHDERLSDCTIAEHEIQDIIMGE